MAIFPKTKKKKSKILKYNNGGSFRHSYPAQGAVSNPMAGIGIQYNPTAPIIPSLDAAKYYEESRRRTDEHVEKEREKRRIDEEAGLQRINELKAAHGQKEKLTQEYQEAVSKYLDKSKDINWMFTTEGRNSFRDINSILNPARFQQMASDQANMVANYDQAMQNKTLDQHYIHNNKAVVKNSETGELSSVDLDDLEKNQLIQSGKYSILTNRQYFDEAQKAKTYDLKGAGIDYTGSQLANIDKVMDEVRGNFKSLGQTGTDGGFKKTVSNASQRKAVVDRLTSDGGISPQSEDALKAAYVQSTGGVFDSSGYKQFKRNLIQKASEEAKQYDEKIDLSAMAAMGSGGGKSVDSPTLPTYLFQEGEIQVADDTQFGKNTFGIKIAGKSNTVENEPEIHIPNDGAVYDFYDGAFLETDFEQVQPRGSGDKIAPVFGTASRIVGYRYTGESSIVENGKEASRTKYNEYKGGLANGKHVSGNIQKDASGRSYFKDKSDPKMRIYVEPVALKVINVIEDGKFTGRTVMHQMSPDESVLYFGNDYSGNTTLNAFDGEQIKPQAINIFDGQLQNISNQAAQVKMARNAGNNSPELENQLRGLIRAQNELASLRSTLYNDDWTLKPDVLQDPQKAAMLKSLNQYLTGLLIENRRLEIASRVLKPKSESAARPWVSIR